MSTIIRVETLLEPVTKNGVAYQEHGCPEKPEGYEDTDIVAKVGDYGDIYMAIPIEVIREWTKYWEGQGYKFVFLGYSGGLVWWGQLKDFEELLTRFKVVGQYGINFC
ncbi:MAG: hypothetical protein NT141_01835 [candidate division WWE3 bacterium]|nr:hypothetical protein [candidate division WWE3 bacterium]